VVTNTSKRPTVGAVAATRWAERRSARSTNKEVTQRAPLSAESWEIAKAQSVVLGPPNGLVSDLIRSISNARINPTYTDPGSFRLFAHQSASFLVKVSPTMASALFFAAQEYFPAQLFAIRPLTKAKLISLFDPDELLAVITSTYLARTCRKVISEGIWVAHQEKIVVHSFLGGLIGRNSPDIGFGCGLIIAFLDYIAFLAQASVRIDPFQKLQERLRLDQKIFDPDLELEWLSCCHRQVASAIATWSGFDARLRGAFHGEADDSPCALALEAITQIHETGTLKKGLKDRLFDKAAEERVLRAAHNVRSNPRQLSPWFLRSATDLPPYAACELGISFENQEEDGPAR
jgi:hypothetical protein